MTIDILTLHLGLEQLHRAKESRFCSQLWLHCWVECLSCGYCFLASTNQRNDATGGRLKDMENQIELMTAGETTLSEAHQSNAT